MNKTIKNFPLRKITALVAMGAATFAFVACNGDASEEYGAPDRWAEDPYGDTENPPVTDGTVGGADPRQAPAEGAQAQPQQEGTGAQDDQTAFEDDNVGMQAQDEDTGMQRNQQQDAF
jgi:hypothetical protein